MLNICWRDVGNFHPLSPERNCVPPCWVKEVARTLEAEEKCALYRKQDVPNATGIHLKACDLLRDPFDWFLYYLENASSVFGLHCLVGSSLLKARENSASNISQPSYRIGIEPVPSEVANGLNVAWSKDLRPEKKVINRCGILVKDPLSTCHEVFREVIEFPFG